MLNVGVSGYRKAGEVVHNILYEFLETGDIVHVGDQYGADAHAYACACARNDVSVREPYVAYWDTYGDSAGPKRNQQIVNNSDVLVAFPNKYSRGTRGAIRMANQAEIPVIIFYLDSKAEQLSSSQLSIDLSEVYAEEIFKRVLKLQKTVL